MVVVVATASAVSRQFVRLANSCDSLFVAASLVGTAAIRILFFLDPSRLCFLTIAGVSFSATGSIPTPSVKSGEPMQNNVRSLRKEKQWSQKDLALRLGVSPPCIDAIERERFLPSIQLAYEIAAVFERPVTDVFLDRTQEPSSRSDPKSTAVLPG